MQNSLLDIRNLHVDYRKPDGTLWTVLRVPRFDLDEGAQVVVKGASGSGKTTFLNVGVAAGIGPAVSAYRTDVANGLAPKN